MEDSLSLKLFVIFRGIDGNYCKYTMIPVLFKDTCTFADRFLITRPNEFINRNIYDEYHELSGALSHYSFEFDQLNFEDQELSFFTYNKTMQLADLNRGINARSKNESILYQKKSFIIDLKEVKHVVNMCNDDISLHIQYKTPRVIREYSGLIIDAIDDIVFTSNNWHFFRSFNDYFKNRDVRANETQRLDNDNTIAIAIHKKDDYKFFKIPFNEDYNNQCREFQLFESTAILNLSDNSKSEDSQMLEDRKPKIRKPKIPKVNINIVDVASVYSRYIPTDREENNMTTEQYIGTCFTINKIIFSGSKTIVLWKDGTKTIVTCQDDEELFDPEKAVMAAFTKKVLSKMPGNSEKRSMNELCSLINKRFDECYRDDKES